MASSISLVRRTMFGGRLGARKRSTFYLEPFLLPRVSSFAERREPLYPRPMSSLQAAIEAARRTNFRTGRSAPGIDFQQSRLLSTDDGALDAGRDVQGADVSLSSTCSPRSAARTISSQHLDEYFRGHAQRLRRRCCRPACASPDRPLADRYIPALERFRAWRGNSSPGEIRADVMKTLRKGAQDSVSDSRSICWAKRS